MQIEEKEKQISDQLERIELLSEKGWMENLIKILLDKNVTFPKSLKNHEQLSDLLLIMGSIFLHQIFRKGDTTYDGNYECTHGANYLEITDTKESTTFKKKVGQNWDVCIKIPIKKQKESFKCKILNTRNDKSGIFIGFGNESMSSRDYWKLSGIAKQSAFPSSMDRSRLLIDKTNQNGYPEKGLTYILEIDQTEDRIEILHGNKQTIQENKDFENQYLKYQIRTDKKPSSFGTSLYLMILLYYEGNEVKLYKKNNDSGNQQFDDSITSVAKEKLFEYFKFFYATNNKEYQLEVINLLPILFSINEKADTEVLIAFFLESFELYERKKLDRISSNDLSNLLDEENLRTQDFAYLMTFQSPFSLAVFNILKEHKKWTLIQKILIKKNPKVAELIFNSFEDGSIKNHQSFKEITSKTIFNSSLMNKLMKSPNLKHNLKLTIKPKTEEEKKNRKIFNVHKELFVLRSNFFYLLNKNDWKETSSLVIEIESLTESTLSAYIEFMYTSKLHVTNLNDLFNLLMFSSQYFEYSLTEAVIEKILERFAFLKNYEEQITKFAFIVFNEFPKSVENRFLNFWNKHYGENQTSLAVSRSMRYTIKKKTSYQIEIQELKALVSKMSKRIVELENRVSFLEKK